MRKYLLLMALFGSQNLYAATQSFNTKWIGTWKGSAPTKALCSGGRDKVELKIIPRIVKPGENYKVDLEADWGCFSKMTIPGFIFGNEFWAASEDRMTFVKMVLIGSSRAAGEFRFDLNGQTLDMSFTDLKKD